MATGYFLLDNPNRRAQYGRTRRRSPWGVGPIPQCVLHTYEAPHTRSLLAAATYLITRTTPGSYHWLAGDDSPTDAMPLAPVTAETWHCIPSNPWASSVSAICYAAEWGRMPARSRSNLVRSMAYAAHRMSLELIALGKSPIPAKWISREEAMRGVWGFVYHRQMDPGRRSDPDNRADAFPRDEFMAEYTRLMGGTTTTAAPAPKEWDEMASKDEVKAAVAEALAETRYSVGNRNVFDMLNDIRKIGVDTRAATTVLVGRDVGATIELDADDIEALASTLRESLPADVIRLAAQKLGAES